ncbi:Malto-oligosyltrehalose trehalohydrolase [Stieleria bergensis]|uniref:Malto-oligosyltrehalose trehalohydrolase n=1 Tax=Stieleria bergensis TaxID=2528025 RepID=A0A517T303_9BACT|nr:Malto-oligosyltrehalose trehalohydrolase [Planctomycetes bacterium SV_7m_r]
MSTEPSLYPDHQLHRILGAHLLSDGQTRFVVYAPGAQTVSLIYGAATTFDPEVQTATRLAMQATADGYFQAFVIDAPAGTHYQYSVDDRAPRPDPASRSQPLGVHGPSEVVDPAFQWTDQSWQGVSREDLIIYELHLGAFTEQGTFLAAIKRLPELVELGVTAIELMPVAASAGRWNWGYDGVDLFAPMAAYGTPADFRRLVDAAHQAGLAVILDVVYNHLGPEGNYLNEFGPYLSSKHQTVWGDAPNFDDPELGRQVGRFFIANAVHWLEEYHLDGLRVDAIHCMIDESPTHVALKMSDAIHAWKHETKRPVLMIAESNVYDPEMLVPRSEGGVGFDAMWADDFLHSVFTTLRPEQQHCHRPYHGASDLVQTLSRGYVYQGTLRSEPERQSDQPAENQPRVPSDGLIYSIQNHDFIGNHPLGVRMHQWADDDVQRAAAALMLLGPAIPMLFMGEEFASPNPFCFFVDFSDPFLRQCVIDGRKREYPHHSWDQGVLPTDPAAFHQAKIGPVTAGNSETLAWYRQLIAVRKQSQESGLFCDANLTVACDPEVGLYRLDYHREASSISVRVRLCDPSMTEDLQMPFEGRVIMDSRGHSVKGDTLCLSPNHAVVLAVD